MNGTLTTAPASDAWVLPGLKLNVRNTSLFDWLFIILGGLPLYLPILFLMGERKLSGSDPISWYLWMNAAISAPHVYSTYCRLGRKISEGKVSWWVGFPGYAFWVAALALAFFKGVLLQAMTAINVWQSLHYLRQVYGVSRVFSRGDPMPAFVRHLTYAAFHLAMPLFILGRWNLLYTVWSGHASSTIIPVQMASGLMTACWILAGVAVAAGVAAEGIRYQRSTQGYDPTWLVILIVYFAIHAFGFLSATYYQRGFFAVTIFHAIQYLGLVWLLERDRAKGWLNAPLSAVPRYVSFPLFWIGLFIGAYGFEHFLVPHTGLIVPVLATVGLSAISAHHYTVDTFMWRRDAGL